jgi:hypothetical protein
VSGWQIAQQDELMKISNKHRGLVDEVTLGHAKSLSVDTDRDANDKQKRVRTGSVCLAGRETVRSGGG